MLDVHPHLIEAVEGSFAPYVYADVWYDGRLSYQGLPVTDWSVRADAESMVERSATLTVASEDEGLVPRLASSPLAPFGSEINLRAGVDLGRAGIYSTSMGWFPITRSDPVEAWTTYNPLKFIHPVQSFAGATVGVAAKDRALWLDKARFISAEASWGGTVYGEIWRLCQGIVPVGEHLVDDASMPVIVYETDNRLEACDLVAERINARLSFNVDGEAVLVPRLATGDEWTASNVLVSEPSLTSEGFYNAVRSESTDDDQNTLLGHAYEGAGALRWRGPMKQAPYLRSAPLAKTLDAVRADARTTLANLITKRQVVTRVTSTANYALEVLDLVRWTVGRERAGTAKAIEWRADGTMDMDVWVPFDSENLL